MFTVGNLVGNEEHRAIRHHLLCNNLIIKPSNLASQMRDKRHLVLPRSAVLNVMCVPRPCPSTPSPSSPPGASLQALSSPCSCICRGSHSAATTSFPLPTGRPQPAELHPLPSAHVRSSCCSASAWHPGPCGPSAQAAQTLAGGLSDKSHCISREGRTRHGVGGGLAHS